MPSITVTLNDRDGQHIGDITVADFNVWTEMAPELASRAFNIQGWTPDMVRSGEVVALFKITSNGGIHYVMGALQTQGGVASGDSMPGRLKMSAESYVIRADGTVEH